MAKPVRRHHHYTYLIDPKTSTRYVLLEIIGRNVHTHNHNSFDLIYVATKIVFSHATLKFIRSGLNIDWPTVEIYPKFRNSTKGNRCYITLYIRRISPLHCSALLGFDHKRFSAGNIYVNFKQRPIWNAEIKLGFAATIYDFRVGTTGGVLFKICHSDIWLVDVAALELAYGNLRISDRKDFEGQRNCYQYVLEERTRGRKKTHRFFKAFNNKLKYVKTETKFEELVLDYRLCSKNSKRPSVGDLLQRPFFLYAKNLKWFQRRVLYPKNIIQYLPHC